MSQILSGVAVYAFKKPRSQSWLKHTGIYLEVETAGVVSHWIHEVSGGTDAGGPKSCLLFREKKDHEEFEELNKVTTFTFHEEERSIYQSLFEYQFDYHLLFSNCRDHVRYFIDRLEERGYLVSQETKDWVREIKVKDIIIAGVATAAIVGGISLLVGWLSGSKSSKEDDHKS